VGVLVSVDSDDEIDVICQHGHGDSFQGNQLSVPVWKEPCGRTVMSHTASTVDKLLIRPTHGDQAGAGTSSHIRGLLTLNGGTLAMGGTQSCS